MTDHWPVTTGDTDSLNPESGVQIHRAGPGLDYTEIHRAGLGIDCTDTHYTGHRAGPGLVRFPNPLPGTQGLGLIVSH